MENSDISPDLPSLSAEIGKLLRAKDFDAAISVFLRNSAAALSPNLLVSKSLAIQLADNPMSYNLDDARNSLLDAISLDDKYVDAWIDLGYFYFAIDDDANKAVACFERATQLSQELYKNSILGMAKALAELGSFAAASQILEMPNLINQSPEFEDFRADLIDYKRGAGHD